MKFNLAHLPLSFSCPVYQRRDDCVLEAQDRQSAFCWLNYGNSLETSLMLQTPGQGAQQKAESGNCSVSDLSLHRPEVTTRLGL